MNDREEEDEEGKGGGPNDVTEFELPSQAYRGGGTEDSIEDMSREEKNQVEGQHEEQRQRHGEEAEATIQHRDESPYREAGEDGGGRYRSSPVGGGNPETNTALRH